MHVARNTVVRLRYRISDAQGEVIDAGEQPLEYLHGGHGEFFDAIERKLDGAEPGFAAEYHLEPEQAFGEYDAALLRVLPLDQLPDNVEPGMQFEGLPEAEGEDAERIFTVTDVDDDGVVLDGNHPLAGIALRVWVQIEEVRAASEDEIENGHADSFGLRVLDARGGSDTLH